MLVSTSKTILADKLQGIRPMPSDESLTEIALEAMIYIATRTTPSVLIKDVATDGQEFVVLRVIEDNKYIVYPQKPVYDLRDPNYSEISILNIDEDLSYAVVYYMAELIVHGNENISNQSTSLSKFMSKVNEYISLYDSNFSRAGRETYGLM